MDNGEFEVLAQKIVVDYISKHTLAPGGILPKFAVFTVWLSKVLENNKGMFACTLPDGRYFEVTYNGDKNEFYLDTYSKVSNEVIQG